MVKQAVRSIKQEMQSIRQTKLPYARAMTSKLKTARMLLLPHGEDQRVKSLIQAIDNGEVREKDVIPTREYPYLPVVIDLEGWDGRSLSTYQLDVEILEAKLQSLTASLPSESEISAARDRITQLTNDAAPIASEYTATHGVVISCLLHVVSLLNQQAGRSSKLMTTNDQLTRIADSVDVPVTLFPIEKDEATRDMMNALRTAVHSNLGGNSILSSDAMTRATAQYIRVHGPIKSVEMLQGEGEPESQGEKG